MNSTPASTIIENAADKARSAAMASDWVTAQTQLQAALKDEPRSTELHLLLGHTNLNLGDVANALECYQKCVVLSPTVAVVHACCALTLQLLGRRPEADMAADKALLIDPSDLVALKVKARVAIEQGAPDKALRFCERILKVNPQDTDALQLAKACPAEPADSCASPTAHRKNLFQQTEATDVSDAELRQQVQSLLDKHGFRRLQRAGFHVQMNDFYSPLNDCDFLEKNPDLWQNPPPIPRAIDWRIDEQMESARQVARFGHELDDVPDRAPADHSKFGWKNGFWEKADALVQYGLVRGWKPRRYVEIGSGWSSLLLKRALARNIDEGSPCDVVLIEPYPNTAIFKHLPSTWTIHKAIIQRADLTLFDALEAGDILFYDGSHCSKAGSDVNWFFFQVLPRIKPGVLIHIHDIMLPHDYPNAWIFERGQTWNEQYVLQAFLMNNNAYRIVLANMFLAVHRRVELEQLYGTARSVNGGSFWIQKIVG